jgi:hypothetical protein
MIYFAYYALNNVSAGLTRDKALTRNLTLYKSGTYG